MREIKILLNVGDPNVPGNSVKSKLESIFFEYADVKYLDSEPCKVGKTWHVSYAFELKISTRNHKLGTDTYVSEVANRLAKFDEGLKIGKSPIFWNTDVEVLYDSDEEEEKCVE